MWCVPEWPVINEPSGSERRMRGSSRLTVRFSRTTRHSCACGTVASIDGGQCEPCGYERIPNQGEQRGSGRGGGEPPYPAHVTFWTFSFRTQDNAKFSLRTFHSSFKAYFFRRDKRELRWDLGRNLYCSDPSSFLGSGRTRKVPRKRENCSRTQSSKNVLSMQEVGEPKKMSVLLQQ